MKTLDIQTNSIDETHQLGKKLGMLVKPQMVILLNG
jgi:tRNA A37 threonylcarbamoyladenosine biosynthesis protein TsaE